MAELPDLWGTTGQQSTVRFAEARPLLQCWLSGSPAPPALTGLECSGTTTTRCGPIYPQNQHELEKSGEFHENWLQFPRRRSCRPKQRSFGELYLREIRPSDRLARGSVVSVVDCWCWEAGRRNSPVSGTEERPPEEKPASDPGTVLRAYHLLIHRLCATSCQCGRLPFLSGVPGQPVIGRSCWQTTEWVSLRRLVPF